MTNEGTRLRGLQFICFSHSIASPRLSSACLLFLATSPSCVHSLHTEIFVFTTSLDCGSPDSFDADLTCLLGAPPRRGAARPVPGRVEGGYADHIGGVTSQVLQLHPSFGHEQSAQSLRLVLSLELPEVNLTWNKRGRNRLVYGRCSGGYFCFYKTLLSENTFILFPVNVFLRSGLNLKNPPLENTLR